MLMKERVVMRFLLNFHSVDQTFVIKNSQLYILSDLQRILYNYCNRRGITVLEWKFRI